MPTAIMLLIVAIGSVVFHALSPWWWTPIASNWNYIDTTLVVTFWITGFVFVAVVGFMAYCVYKFRHKEGQRADYEPENKRLEGWLTIATAVGVTAMLVPGLVVWHQFVTVPANATEIEVIGQQWRWSFRLPGKDGKLGTSDVANVTPENPLGLTPKDPNNQDDIIVESGDLQVPIGKPVKVLMRSLDVLHNFYVPEFRAKMDMVPGAVTFVWFTPTRKGTFDVLCAELCGVAHSQMRAKVVVADEAEYNAWLAKQQTFAELTEKVAQNRSQRREWRGGGRR